LRQAVRWSHKVLQRRRAAVVRSSSFAVQAVLHSKKLPGALQMLAPLESQQFEHDEPNLDWQQVQPKSQGQVQVKAQVPEQVQAEL